MHPIITISGSPGSGKSTVAKLIEEKLEFARLNGGDVFRALAKKYKLSLEAMVEKARHEPKINREVDTDLLKTAVAMAKKTPVLFESRLAGWLTAEANISAFRVWVGASLATRASRVGKREKLSQAAAMKLVKSREADEVAAYKVSRGVDLRDQTLYDMIIRTDRLTPVQVRDSIIKGFKEYVRRNQARNDRKGPRTP